MQWQQKGRWYIQNSEKKYLISKALVEGQKKYTAWICYEKRKPNESLGTFDTPEQAMQKCQQHNENQLNKE